MIKQNNETVKVSVIVPVYNAERFLSLSMDSLISQTLKDIEFIVIDDGSTDRSGNICDEYAKKDSRFRIIHSQNGGPGKARNQGLDIARGEYIGFIDSDDYADPQMFEKMYDAAKKLDSDITMCGYNNVNKESVTVQKLNYESVYEGHEEIKNKLISIYYDESKVGIHCLWNKIFKKSLIDENSIRINEKLKRAEDSWFVFDMLKVAKRFSFIEDYLYYYVQNDSSIMHTIQPKQYEQWVYSRKRLLKENDNLNFNLDLNIFYKEFLYNLAVYILALVDSSKTDEVKCILNDDFYKSSAKYTANLPKHIKLLHKIGRKNPNTAIFGYKIWNKIR